MTTATKTHAQTNAEAWSETILNHWDAFRWADDLRSTASGLHSETRQILEDAGAIFGDDDQLTDDSYPCTVIGSHVLDRVQELALSVELRSEWMTMDQFHRTEDLEAGAFRIVLTYGGPHLEIRGEVDACGSAQNPRLLYSEMGQPEAELRLSGAAYYALEWFALQFVCC